MPSVLSLLNRLLPFATPGTPLLQDVLHLAAICLVLYFAPQIQERLQARTSGGHPQNVEHDEHDTAQTPGNNEAPAPEDLRQANDVPQFEEPQHNVDDPEGDNNHDAVGDANVAGPAHAPTNVREPRNVGAKKAKSLARRDQRRAYNEFMRSQGDAARARDAEGAAEREAALAAERERRRTAAAALEEKKAREREKRRGLERRERETENKRRERVVGLVRDELDRRHLCDLCEVARVVAGPEDEVDSEWVEKILVAAGVVGRGTDGKDEMTVVTGTGWAVRVSREDMMALYDRLAKDGAEDDEDGMISHEQFGRGLEVQIREREAIDS